MADLRNGWPCEQMTYSFGERGLEHEYVLRSGLIVLHQLVETLLVRLRLLHALVQIMPVMVQKLL